jgi:hypothetical protein
MHPHDIGGSILILWRKSKHESSDEPSNGNGTAAPEQRVNVQLDIIELAS